MMNKEMLGMIDQEAEVSVLKELMDLLAGKEKESFLSRKPKAVSIEIEMKKEPEGMEVESEGGDWMAEMPSPAEEAVASFKPRDDDMGRSPFPSDRYASKMSAEMIRKKMRG